MRVDQLFLELDGRIGRGTFVGGLVAAGIYSGGLAIMVLLFAPDSLKPLAFIAEWLFALYIFLALCAKRWRDIGQSPWFTLLMFIPVVNLLLLIYLCIAPTAVDRAKRPAHTPISKPVTDTAAAKPAPKEKTAISIRWLLFSFNGLARRGPYLLGVLIYAAVMLLIEISVLSQLDGINPAIRWTALLPTTYLILALSAKRWRDVGLSPWFALFNIVPGGIGYFVTAALCMAPSKVWRFRPPNLASRPSRFTSARPGVHDQAGQSTPSDPD